MSATQNGFVAVSRFGLGAAPGELAIASADPKAWLRDQLQPERALPTALRSRPASSGWVGDYVNAYHRGEGAIVELLEGPGERLYYEEVDAHLSALAGSRRPFFDRLALFWANHFTVSGKRTSVAPIVGAFAREVVRPNLLGRFEDMLLAAVRHPAMQLYLNNVGSVGPGSRVAGWTDQGLNENLAREILELHTLGVNGGYGQRDVIELAKIITGWTVHGILQGNSNGRYYYEPRMHEPGARHLLGKTIAEGQENQGVTALRMLARHPSTARFVATKLAQHFIADDPPVSAVRQLQNVFLNTGGDLRALALALIDLPQAWDVTLPKTRTHLEYVVAASRALDVKPVPVQTLRASLFQMGQTPFMTPSPAGWPDRSDHWMTPEALMRRADFATLIAERAAPSTSPGRLLDQTIGPVVPQQTRQKILRAPSTSDAIALTLASIPFHRR